MGLHHVVTLLLDDCVLLDVAIPVHVFGYHGDGRYRFTLAGHHRGPVRTSTGVVLQAQADLGALATADTIVVPGYVGVLRPPPPPPPVLAGLRAAATRGARLLSICTGAFALAYAGLLDGRRATTHWNASEQLGERMASCIRSAVSRVSATGPREPTQSRTTRIPTAQPTCCDVEVRGSAVGFCSLV